MEKSATPLLPLAGWWRRISAMLYEAILLLALWFIADYAFIALTHNVHSPFEKIVLQVYLLLVTASYFIWFWMRGQTLAMKTWRIRVVNTEGTAITFQQALTRFGIATILLGFSQIWGLFDRDRQFLHDRLSGTRLVRTDV